MSKKVLKKAKKSKVVKHKKHVSKSRYFVYGIAFFIFFALSFIIIAATLKPLVP